jgi:hypothetical protein
MMLSLYLSRGVWQVEACVKCQESSILGEDILSDLKEYLTLGPFYAPASQAEMETMT